MYRPNFCSDCGAKIIRRNWYPWTSRRFCDSCSRRLRKERLTIPLVVGASLVIVGLLAGLKARPRPLTLIIERNRNSPLYNPPNLITTEDGNQDATGEESSNVGTPSNSPSTDSGEVIYTCGARTKKGVPCSRRVHGPIRCWQHKGMPSMLPAEKLIVR